MVAHNMGYQQMSSVEDVLASLFLPAEHSKEYFLTTTQIQQKLRESLITSDVPTLRKLGLALKRQHFPYGSLEGVHGYYLQPRSAG